MEKLKDLIYDQLGSRFDQIETSRLEFVRRINRRENILWGSGIILVALGLVSIYGGLLIKQFILFYAMFTIFVLSAQKGLIEYMIKDYKLEYKDLVIAPIVHSLQPEAQYNSFNHIPQEVYHHTGLFEKNLYRFNGEDLIKGEIDKTWFHFSEMFAQGETGGEDSSTYTIFKGLFVMADFHKNFEGWTTITPEKSNSNMKLRGDYRELDVADMENVAFEKKYVVKTNDQVEARYILSLGMMENILALEKRFNCQPALSFKDSKVYITIPWKNDMLEPDFRKPANDRETIYKFFDELKLCFGIIDELNLNTRIWTKV